MRRGHAGPLAAALVIAAIGIPATAWWVAGTREADREEARLRADALSASCAAAQDLAGRVVARLGRLADAEARRPFYHYRNLFHDPSGVSEGASVVPSPLAGPPADPLVRAYFQVDAAGHVTLPRLNDALPELNPSPDVRALCALRDDLAAAAAQITASVQPECAPGSQQVLDAAAWRQIAAADDLYSRLRGERAPREAVARPPAADVVTCVGPLLWRTLPVGGRDALLGLRHVETPDGTLTQGFLVEPAELAGLLPQGARLAPGPGDPQAALVPLAGTDWHVTVDAEDALRAASEQAASLRHAFARTFAGGLAVALAAGAGVLGLAWQARRLARRREEFAAAAAHELRTPLASLRLHGGMLAGGLGDPAQAPVHAQRMAEDAERLSRVVTNLLTYTLRERGELGVSPVVCDVGSEVRAQVERQRVALEAAGAGVEVEVADDAGPAWCDPDSLAHVVQNLLDNAARHARDASDRLVRVGVARGRGADTVEVSVEDAGPGVPRHLRSRIFEPFNRQGERAGGLGLGLSLARSLARAGGGDLTCEDGRRGGARFVLVLPTRDTRRSRS